MDADTYASGTEFLAAVETQRPDCLLLDVRMPGMTGPELRLRLLALGHRIPILFITAHAADLPIASLEPGETIDILHKPFDDEALLASIERCMGKSHPGP